MPCIIAATMLEQGRHLTSSPLGRGCGWTFRRPGEVHGAGSRGSIPAGAEEPPHSPSASRRERGYPQAVGYAFAAVSIVTGCSPGLSGPGALLTACSFGFRFAIREAAIPRREVVRRCGGNPNPAQRTPAHHAVGRGGRGLARGEIKGVHRAGGHPARWQTRGRGGGGLAVWPG